MAIVTTESLVGSEVTFDISVNNPYIKLCPDCPEPPQDTRAAWEAKWNNRHGVIQAHDPLDYNAGWPEHSRFLVLFDGETVPMWITAAKLNLVTP